MMLQTTRQRASPDICRHHWIIEPANGPVSLGMCRICLKEREFKNFIELEWVRSRAEGEEAIDCDGSPEPDR